MILITLPSVDHLSRLPRNLLQLWFGSHKATAFCTSRFSLSLMFSVNYQDGLVFNRRLSRGADAKVEESDYHIRVLQTNEKHEEKRLINSSHEMAKIKSGTQPIVDLQQTISTFRCLIGRFVSYLCISACMRIMQCIHTL